eukprot:gnl/TRDRNA2_/TRDRNA2_177916_c1_seq6.p2 gnl/TRDRNA2_/TRDRNA2_177916_c1~~gnl/TRDRNA2_/TRDRNA2_177916_c1_seq6.p2  ORF type:complete len:131 (+),score=11.30 gnl/TRDRNA2_/TRDRNA2_177916_c1_seq6:247-639(+)
MKVRPSDMKVRVSSLSSISLGADRKVFLWKLSLSAAPPAPWKRSRACGSRSVVKPKDGLVDTGPGDGSGNGSRLETPWAALSQDGLRKSDRDVLIDTPDDAAPNLLLLLSLMKVFDIFDKLGAAVGGGLS